MCFHNFVSIKNCATCIFSQVFTYSKQAIKQHQVAYPICKFQEIHHMLQMIGDILYVSFLVALTRLHHCHWLLFVMIVVNSFFIVKRHHLLSATDEWKCVESNVCCRTLIACWYYKCLLTQILCQNKCSSWF